MDNFKDLGWNDRVELVEEALAETLAGLRHTAATADVAAVVAGKLNADRRQIMGMLVRMATKHPLASQTGRRFVMYGREARAWLWQPGTDRPAPESYLAKAHGPTAPAGLRIAIDNMGMAVRQWELDGDPMNPPTHQQVRILVNDLIDRHLEPLVS